MVNPLRSKRILCVSGSLRTGSFNTSLLKALVRVCPRGVEASLAEPLDRVPHFNPDLDTDCPPCGVEPWREELRGADGIVVCSPEYARGVPGVLKNAFDWIVSSGELEHKPIALINASPSYTGASEAHHSLKVILRTMGARLDDESCLSLGGVRGKVNRNGEVSDADTRAELETVFRALLRAMNNCDEQ